MNRPTVEEIRVAIEKADLVKKRNKELGIPEIRIIDYISLLPSKPIDEKTKELYRELSNTFRTQRT